MKTIRILKLHERFFGPNRLTLDEAARAMSKRTGYSIVPIESGFEVSGEWRAKFLTEQDFANRIARDLQLASGVIFDSIVEG